MYVGSKEAKLVLFQHRIEQQGSYFTDVTLNTDFGYFFEQFTISNSNYFLPFDFHVKASRIYIFFKKPSND